MQLPGGLLIEGVLRRDYKFRPVDGALELAIAESADRARNAPQAVTLALLAALASLAGEYPSEQLINNLCVMDRQFLMRQLDILLGHRGGWFHAVCRECKEAFDFQLDYAQLPVHDAPAGYPFAQVQVADVVRRFRLPTGDDQLALHDIEGDPRMALLERLHVDARASADDNWCGRLDEAHITAIEAALEAVAPAVLTQVEASCPNCSCANAVGINPYGALEHGDERLLDEVHRIAYSYHWGEADILAMPQARRHRYLDLIDRARGMSAMEA